MNCRLGMIVMAWLFLGGLSPAQTRTGPHDPEKDKQAVVALRGLMARPYSRDGLRSRSEFRIP